MNIWLCLAFLFFIGSILGWVLELVFRRFFSSANPERKWINPGFLVGPYVPLYGTGLCLLFLIARLERFRWISDPLWNRIVLFAVMALAMTVIEYIAGILLLKVMHLRLWDYSHQWGNIQGLICPKFSLAWAAMGGAYYFLVDPYILNALRWLSENLAFSFFIGVFFGCFAIDLAYSTNLAVKIRQFAQDHQIVLRYEALKADLKKRRTKNLPHFFLALHPGKPMGEFLEDYYVRRQERREEIEALFRKKRK